MATTPSAFSPRASAAAGARGAARGGLVSIGGSGNSSGNGGGVTVTTSGGILTSGWNSDCILAQSIGGGGGRARASGGAITIGGQGGSSGSGANVTVTNNGGVTTGGVNACGISAQSIGGGGGRGGGVYGVAPFMSATFGGSAAGGGNGGTANVWSKNVTIKTAGDLSHGIHAQSIGGGGGSGGSSFAAAAGVVVTGECAIGGSGGDGGFGGQVTLRNDGPVTTQGRQAHALFAESLGGGGGSGGRAVSLSATIGVLDLPSLNFGYTIGGSGGDGGNGAAVTADNHGNLTTSKARSYGILGQSVGGGGGDGGNSVHGGLTFLASDFSLKIGGSGGLGGNGGSVVIDSTGNISTQGNSAYGVLGQSIGGGGGSGGDSLVLSIDIADMEEILQTMITPSISQLLTMGGSGGNAGTGATVQVTNQGAVGTQGSFAHGVLAQSVGGGGGASGDECVLEFPNIPDALDQVRDTISLSAILKTQGSAGNGGAITVNNQNNIATQGKFAQGILAQSVGGGGGASGIVIHDPFELVGLTSSPKLTIRGGSGSGAAVTVTNSADITTQGGFAHGILAQSVGGGGGFACISECILGSVLDKLPGAMGVTLSDTPGLGIGFVGSATGFGSAGAVTVTAGGHITANGVNSHGVLAQSVGSSRGNISVTISGIVQGGTGDGAGVMIDGGAVNTVTNTGGIGALSGKAIVAGIGNDTAHNYGTVTGTVSLGSGANALNNYAGATFNSGELVDLGAGMPLTNAGVISPGGAGIVAETALVGNLVQAAGGVLEADVGCSPGGARFDRIDITGNLTLNDAWILRLCYAGGTTSAEEKYDLFTFAGTYTGLMSFGPGNIDAGGTGWDVYSASIVVDTATPGSGRVYLTGLDSSRLAGDVDCDGVVDAADYIALKRRMGLGSAAVRADGDLDRDGDVDWNDLQLLMSNFGRTSAGLPVSIPEPATLFLLALGRLAMLRRRQ